MKRTIAYGLCLVFLLGMFPAAAWAEEGAAGGPVEVEAQLPEDQNAPAGNALAQYRTIISQADTYQYDPDGYSTPTGVYQYALVQLTPEDPAPTLLLSQETTGYMFCIRVFQYDPASGTVLQPGEALWEGSPELGGARTGLTMHGDGYGLWSAVVMGGTGEMEIYRTTVENGQLKTETAWSGRFDNMPDMPFTAIQWYDIGDLSALDAWTSVGSGTGSEGTDAPDPEVGTAGAPVLEDMGVDSGYLESLGISMKELEFILAECPTFEVGQTVSDMDLGQMLMVLTVFHDTTYFSDGLIAPVGGSYPPAYDRGEVNRIFSLLTDEAFVPERNGQYGSLFTVNSDTIVVNPATPNSGWCTIDGVRHDSASGCVLIDYTLDIYVDPVTPDIEEPRTAVLAPVEGGYRIIAIQAYADGAALLASALQAATAEPATAVIE